MFLQVLFKADFIFKDFSRQYCIFKYFSNLCEPCNKMNFSEISDLIGPVFFFKSFSSMVVSLLLLVLCFLVDLLCVCVRWGGGGGSALILDFLCSASWVYSVGIVRDFPRPDFGPNISASQLKNEQKLPIMVYISPNILVLHFGENFMKIRTKIAKLQMHENLHIKCKFSGFFMKGN